MTEFELVETLFVVWTAGLISWLVTTSLAAANIQQKLSDMGGEVVWSGAQNTVFATVS